MVLPFGFYENKLLQVVDCLPVFSYIENPTGPSSPLTLQLRHVLGEQALKADSEQYSLLSKIPIFEEEVRRKLAIEVPLLRQRYERGDFDLPNKIRECRTYPLYKFVREELGTSLLSGPRGRTPGEDIDKVFIAITEGKLEGRLMECLDGWNESPGPFNDLKKNANNYDILKSHNNNSCVWSWFQQIGGPQVNGGKGYWLLTIA